MLGEGWDVEPLDWRDWNECDDCKDQQKRFNTTQDYIEKLVKALYVNRTFSEEDIFDIMQDLTAVAQVEFPSNPLSFSREEVKINKIEQFPYFREAVQISDCFMKSVNQGGF